MPPRVGRTGTILRKERPILRSNKMQPMVKLRVSLNRTMKVRSRRQKQILSLLSFQQQR